MGSNKENDIDHNIGWLLKTAFDVYHAMTVQTVRELGFSDVTASQARLIAVFNKKSIRAIDLAELAGVSKQAASVTLSELIDSGYLEQRKSTTDGRVRLLSLTEKGYALKRAAGDVKVTSERMISAVIGPEEKAHLAAQLKKITALPVQSTQLGLSEKERTS
ncbi:MarR family winged helix-turn-helix transcriptional regulator [Aestuariibius sp. HNIBRBA575]|uniref:MarR family winged helix-turn-helix transcriptional regulator n=1 Tax=Aestuariibius sp. HNIBRBA575 TaxID=3233343 RepID=UPI0034A598FC